MSTIVRAAFPASQFALYETLQRAPTAQFEVVRAAASGSGDVLPLLWATAESEDEFESLPDLVDADASVRGVDVVTKFDDEYLLRVNWGDHVRSILETLLSETATVLDARSEGDDWQFRLLLPEHDTVSAMYRYCEERGLDIDFKQITKLSDSFRQCQFGLTEDQYETIIGAYREGYYAIPRKANLEELSDQFDVSHQALSERLRRGHENLVENAMQLEANSI